METANSFAYIACDVSPGHTLDDYRRTLPKKQRNRIRRTLRRVLRRGNS